MIWVAFSAFLLVNGSQLVQQMIGRGNVSTAMRIPMYLVYIVLPLSAFVLCLRLTAQIVEDVKTLFSGRKEAE